MRWDHAEKSSGEIISFAEAKARLGTRPKNKFAMELEDIARNIRLGEFDPTALCIVFRAQHPEDKEVIQYPIASIDMDRTMMLALINYFRSLL